MLRLSPTLSRCSGFISQSSATFHPRFRMMGWTCQAVFSSISLARASSVRPRVLISQTLHDAGPSVGSGSRAPIAPRGETASEI